MKCQILFPGKKNKKNIILSSAVNAQRVVKVNVTLITPRTVTGSLPLLMLVVKQCWQQIIYYIEKN